MGNTSVTRRGKEVVTRISETGRSQTRSRKRCPTASRSLTTSTKQAPRLLPMLHSPETYTIKAQACFRACQSTSPEELLLLLHTTLHELGYAIPRSKPSLKSTQTVCKTMTETAQYSSTIVCISSMLLKRSIVGHSMNGSRVNRIWESENLQKSGVIFPRFPRHEFPSFSITQVMLFRHHDPKL